MKEEYIAMIKEAYEEKYKAPYGSTSILYGYQDIIIEAIKKVQAHQSGAANVRQGQDGESGEVLRAEVEKLIAWCHDNCFKADYDNGLVKVPVAYLIRLDHILEGALYLLEDKQDA